MSLGQPTSPNLVGTSPTPRLKIEASSTVFLPDPRNITMMCWTMHTGGIVNVYNDILTFSDHNEVVGMVLKSDGTNLRLGVGDLLHDWSSTSFIAADNTWNHFCFTSQATTDANTSGTGSGPARVIAYANGHYAISTDQAEDAAATSRAIEAPLQNNTSAPPAGPSFISVFNSRASDTDAGAVFQGNICAVKIWEAVLTPEEIRREMWAITPQKQEGLWGWAPLHTLDTRTHMYANRSRVDWTSMGSNFVQGTSDPPGLLWDAPYGGRDASAYFNPVIVDQEGFRWRNDDGTESTATWAAAQDTAVTKPVGQNMRVRFVVNATGDPSAAQYQIEWHKVGSADPWRKVK